MKDGRARIENFAPWVGKEHPSAVASPRGRVALFGRRRYAPY